MNNHFIIRFTLIGVVFGLIFAVFGWILAAFTAGLPFSFSTFTAIHDANPVVYIPDLAPFVLGTVFFALGRAHQHTEKDQYVSSGELQLSSVLRTMADGFITISEDGTILSFNLAAEKIFGYEEKKIRGQKISVLMPTFFEPTENQAVDGYSELASSGISGKAGREIEGQIKDEGVVPLAITASEMLIGKKRRISIVIRDITDIKRAQAEAVRTAEELTQFVDTANAPIIGIDSDGLVNEWNQTAANITGFAKEEVLGKDLVEQFITDEYKAPVGKVLDNALVGNQTANFEFPLYTKGGQRVDVLLNATTRRDVDGQIIGVIGVGQDITEGKKAQAEAVRTAEELTQFVDTANAPIIGIDSDGLVNEWNQTAANITGFAKEEVLGKNLVEQFITDEYKAPVGKVLDNALVGNQTANFEFLLYTKGGQRVDVLLNATTRRDVDGHIIGVIGVGQDITEGKKAQAEAVRTAEELTQFVDTANAPIIGIDSDGLVNEWNQTAANITGFAKQEVLGKDLVEQFITDEYKAPVGKVLDNALVGDETANFEFPLYTKGGQRVDVLLNATTRRDVDGQTVGVIGVGQDITELRQQEKALSQARKMETVGQLTGGIAHDFNNLLSIIGGNLRFLRHDIGEVGEEIEELFEDAMSATRDGADLTARLLAFSRNRELKPELKEVNETIGNFSRFLSRTLGKSIDLKTELSQDQLLINVDTSQLESALLNLAINARDAMPDGGCISISAESYFHSDDIAANAANSQLEVSLDPGNYVLVTVEDNGVGINEEDLGRVYEPFFTTKEVGKGSGLGLSMVYGFIQQSNGQCIVQSEVGKGTKVSMLFPEDPNGVETRKDKSSKGEPAPEGSAVILVVEDEARVRRVTVRDLHKLGYITLEAENAAMAQKIIDSGVKIDLVFSDVLMPGEMDGQMLGSWIGGSHPEIKVVLTSGYTKRKGDRRKIQDPTPSERKPYTVQELKDKKIQRASFPLIRKPYSVEALAQQLRSTLSETPAENREGTG